MAKKSEKPRVPQLEIIEVTESAPKVPRSRAKKTAEPPTAAEAGKTAPKKAVKPRKAKVKIKSESGEEVEIHVPVDEPFKHPANDPIGDVTDGEGRFVAALEPEPESEPQAEMAAHRADTMEAALDGTLENQVSQSEPAGGEPEPARQSGSARLERLQKILSQAGIASRRRAEELITEGRVQVNGQVVTQLGFKADPARDHIRVDGKLLSGAERLRYYMLNKPKGFVTTVSDPEGRPTVMQFFEKMRERLYPVGRLDYQSEGLLLVTNDGDLANQLTRAASGVQKTYLVKVAGQPTEEQLEQLRSGVAIDREQPGSGKVHTAPAEIRQVRRGDNPWFEVVLIEGRNRELRKMFSAIDHFVEKIRRVGYGPLVLDLEPGRFRELLPEEIAALRLAAAGKWKPRRPKTTKMLPKDAGHAPEQRAYKPRSGKPFREHTGRRENRDWKPREQRFGRPDAKPEFGKRDDRPRGSRPAFGERGGKPAFGARDDRPRGPKPGFGEPQGEPRLDRPRKPRFEREDGEFRPRQQPAGRNFGFRPQQRDGEQRTEDRAGRGPNRQGDRPNFKRGGFDRTEEPRRRFDKPEGRSFSKPRGGDFADRPARRFDKPAGKSFDRPRSEESSGRPSSRFDRSGGSRNQGPARGWNRDREQGSAPFAKAKPRFGDQDKPKSGSLKPSFGSRGKPSTGRSKPAFGAKPGFKSGSKPGFKSGFKRSGPPRSGGNRPGGGKRG